MRILVTGGCGFIGSAFLLEHIRAFPEDEILCFDKMTYAANADIPGIASKMSDSFRFVRGDIADRETVFAAFADFRPEAVVNFAAETHVDRSIEDPAPFVRSNVNGTSVLLEACIKYSVPRFHQVSTDEVYGEYLGVPEGGFTENSALCPSNPYAATKAAADMIALSCFRTYGLFVTITRGANTYGERQFPEKLIPKTIKLAVRGEKIPVMGDGRARRDWLYVSDHVHAIESVLRDGQPGWVYNVPGETEAENIDIVRRVLDLIGDKRDLISFVPERAGHDIRYLVSGKRIASLGVRNKVTLTHGLAHTVRWYLNYYRNIR